MVSFDVVVGVPVGAVPRRRQQLLQHHWVGRRPVGHHLDWLHLRGTDGVLEEPARCSGITARRDEHINDPPQLVDGAGRRGANGRQPSRRFRRPASGRHRVPAGSGGLGQQRREALDPAVDGGVVDFDAAFGEQFLDVEVGEAEAEVQRTARTITSGGKQKSANADRETGAGRGRRVLIATVCRLRARSPQMQQCRARCRSGW